jgi:hypothetical protein
LRLTRARAATSRIVGRETSSELSEDNVVVFAMEASYPTQGEEIKMGIDILPGSS